MNKYEMLVIISSEANEEQREALITKMGEILTNNGATVDAVDKWGMKKFAYPINYKNEGFYCLFKMTAPSDVPNKVEKVFNITENIVRVMFERK